MAEEHKDQHGDAHGKDAHGGGGHKKHGGHGHGAHEEHEEGVPEWIVSFADNALLQMGFFLILFAMNVGPKGGGEGQEGAAAGQAVSDSFLDAVISIREGFNSPVSLDSKDPKDGPLIRRLKERSGMGSNSQEGVPGKSPDQQAIRPSDYNRVTASTPFDLGKADLSGEGRATMLDAAKRLRGERFIIEVRGHVSAMEAVNGPDEAYKLSFARAQAVAAVLVEGGLKWSQLRVVACGDNDRVIPIAAGTEGHRTNQRVELVVTDQTLPADPHSREKN
jgi:flagellar motor protein MotB